MSAILAQSIPCCDTGGNIFKCGIPASPFCIIIPPATTLTVDSIPTLYYKGAKWLVNVATHPAFTKVSSYEVYGINKSGVATSHTTYAILGQLIPQVVTTAIVGPNMELQITNNDAVSVLVCITRIPIPTSLGVAFIQSSPVTSYTPIIRLVGSIDPADTLVVDTVRYPRVKSVKWLVSVSNLATNEKRALEVYCTYRNGTFVTHTTFGMLADLINIGVNTIQSGSNVSLTITNNEATSLNVEVTRIPIAMDVSDTVCIPQPEGDVLIVTPINNVLIAPAATVSVDSPSFLTHTAVKWLVSVTDTVTNKVMGAQVYATHRNGTLPINTNYAIVGDFISTVFNVVITGTDVDLQITNTGINIVSVDLVRLPVSV